MKKVLIISPNFPPVNSADMQRVRQSLPYFRQYGWEPVVITVDEMYNDAYSKDELLLKTIPTDIEIHKVKAFPLKYTRQLGLGSLSIRSYLHIKKKGDDLLKKQKFDLVYFSTTAFHVLHLGNHWKKKFGTPFIIDMQDPWRNDFYNSNTIKSQNLKLFLYHKLDNYLEAATIPNTDGIISVSAGYIKMYQDRYPSLSKEKFSVIPFGFSTNDFDIAKKEVTSSPKVLFTTGKKNFVYIGRGGNDMKYAVEIIFDGFKKALETYPDIFNKVHLWFIGTDYATSGKGSKTFDPVAKNKGISNQVTEITDRIPYFETLYLLNRADLLIVPGSTDKTYTASKIYPYMVSNKPLLAVFHENSSVCNIINETSAAKVVSFNDNLNEDERNIKVYDCFIYMYQVLINKITSSDINMDLFEKYSAKEMTKQQTHFFNQVVGSVSKNKLQSYA